MNRIAEISVSLPFTSGASVTFDDKIEVSLDCHVCRRYHRTVIFSKGESKGKCLPKKHPFPGRITAKEVSQDKRLTTVKYRLFFDYEPFTVEKSPETLKTSGKLTWARVSYMITCPACGEFTEGSTQNNLVRPLNYYCDCGQLLYSEVKEMPVLSWIDKDASPMEFPETSSCEKKRTLSCDRPQNNDPNTTLEFIRMLTVLILFGILLLICTQIPILLVAKTNPLIGLLAAVAAIPLWLSIVRPMPGLLQGIICVAGVFAILIVNIICLVKVVSWLIS